MKLYLLRHGETKEGKKGIILGHLSGTLTEDGKRYAEKAAKSISTLPVFPDIIMASDLGRAKETAKIISHVTKIPVCFDPFLRERGGGDAEGMREGQIDWQRYEIQKLENRKHKNGESFDEVKKRTDKFLLKLDKDSYKNVFLVTHSVVMAMIISSVLG